MPLPHCYLQTTASPEPAIAMSAHLVSSLQTRSLRNISPQTSCHVVAASQKGKSRVHSTTIHVFGAVDMNEESAIKNFWRQPDPRLADQTNSLLQI